MALEGEDDNEMGPLPLKSWLRLWTDSYIPEPERRLTDKPFLMPIEDVFSISVVVLL